VHSDSASRNDTVGVVRDAIRSSAARSIPNGLASP
jgi:hypothetical protein